MQNQQIPRLAALMATVSRLFDWRRALVVIKPDTPW